MSKLTNRDIQRIIRQWLKEKRVADFARDFQVTRQRVYQLITLFKEIEEYPELKPPGRRSQQIDEGTEELILKSYRSSKLGPTHLEKKIEETYGIHHIPINDLSGTVVPRPGGDQHEETKTAEMGPVRTGSFHVDVARRLEGV